MSKLIIRLKPRSQSKSSLYFYIVVIDKNKSSKSSSIKEKLGFFDRKNNLISLNFYRFFFWLGKGVYISDSVYKLIFFNFLNKIKLS